MNFVRNDFLKNIGELKLIADKREDDEFMKDVGAFGAAGRVIPPVRF